MTAPAPWPEPPPPQRSQEARTHVVDDAMPKSFATELGRWLWHNLPRMHRGGDDAGKFRFNHELVEVDGYNPELFAQLRSCLLRHAGDAFGAVAVEPVEVARAEMHATLYHHGCHYCWHDDTRYPDLSIASTRVLSFAYYAHSDPRMFTGGELEFMDGTLVEPLNNRIAFWDPRQSHCVRRVRCWSAEALHGRWAISGHMHCRTCDDR